MTIEIQEYLCKNIDSILQNNTFQTNIPSSIEETINTEEGFLTQNQIQILKSISFGILCGVVLYIIGPPIYSYLMSFLGNDSSSIPVLHYPNIYEILGIREPMSSLLNIAVLKNITNEKVFYYHKIVQDSFLLLDKGDILGDILTLEKKDIISSFLLNQIISAILKDGEYFTPTQFNYMRILYQLDPLLMYLYSSNNPVTVTLGARINEVQDGIWYLFS